MWLAALRDKIVKSPDVHGVIVHARDADRNKYLLIDIQRNAKSGRISRPSSTDPAVTIKSWERAPIITHTIEADWITIAEVDKEIRQLAKELEAFDVKVVRDDEILETRWLFKPYKLWHPFFRRGTKSEKWMVKK